jgi:hypothetical protein
MTSGGARHAVARRRPRRRLAGQVTVPALPRSELTGLITEDSHWELLSRCFRNRAARSTSGALLLLYGQFASRLTRLTTARPGRSDLCQWQACRAARRGRPA